MRTGGHPRGGRHRRRGPGAGGERRPRTGDGDGDAGHGGGGDRRVRPARAVLAGVRLRLHPGRRAGDRPRARRRLHLRGRVVRDAPRRLDRRPRHLRAGLALDPGQPRRPRHRALRLPVGGQRPGPLHPAQREQRRRRRRGHRLRPAPRLAPLGGPRVRRRVAGGDGGDLGPRRRHRRRPALPRRRELGSGEPRPRARRRPLVHGAIRVPALRRRRPRAPLERAGHQRLCGDRRAAPRRRSPPDGARACPRTGARSPRRGAPWRRRR